MASNKQNQLCLHRPDNYFLRSDLGDASNGFIVEKESAKRKRTTWKDENERVVESKGIWICFLNELVPQVLENGSECKERSPGGSAQGINTSTLHQGPKGNDFGGEERNSPFHSGLERLLNYLRLKTCDIVDVDNKQLQKTSTCLIAKN